MGFFDLCKVKTIMAYYWAQASILPSPDLSLVSVISHLTVCLCVHMCDQQISNRIK